MNPIYSRYYTFIKPYLKNKYISNYSSVVFSLFTITVFSLFAIKPTLSTIVSLQKSIKEQQDILKAISNKTDNLSQANTSYNALDPVIKQKIEDLLPTYTALPELMQNLTDLASAKNASISGLQIQPTDLSKLSDTLQTNTKIQTLEFTLNVTGSYASLNSFLKSILAGPRLIDIQTISFSRPPIGEILVMSINAKSYFYK